ncbi:peptidylprolyl isomerase [Bermanella marisrubri]|uniref:Peptidyl-prolyl cis-trans isomerase n=1 Tax=Bermanella marisrubri TaxID=207949 RepID=Q1MZS7_9GAMM|nr:peptidylprolyl isomerase [Bermanella marisrubri]EAT11480.1 FKBP-type peptidyl-prolyl cis-trans isomerase 2 [Oceanobacter sp. RED65] [Bermanella marisrubri]QIZ85057.1 peptidylprolyl isomerase [Bermanella marisrubri]
MTIEKDKVVTIEFTVKNADTNEVIESSVGAEPLLYLHGHNNLVPGLENALTGKAVGDNYSVQVAPEEGYGVHDDSLIQEVPREMFQGVENIQVGMEFTADGPQGPVVVEVKSVDDKVVTVDANHPLASVTLAFEGEVKDVRDATAEELEHGHVHGPGGHEH